ncbi:hypothetical protein C8F04DRAFT_1301530 [Mycena alexandri]|uniref:DUF6533 domain-containing protein n=1 Tax=Mycena alexandri TaxID=1745969 RepID=A0AAD6SBZ6_9AGAR|nr:hypothetical protein C8F04DRAFT_1301530 [Mycena alexandri]
MATTTASQAELQAELFQLIADAQTTNYLAVASLTLAVVDLIGNFEDEIRLIWKSPVRISNGIYLWIRYFSLITVGIYMSYMLREVKSDHAEAVTSSLVGTVADLILILRRVQSRFFPLSYPLNDTNRVWVLYGKSRRLLYIFIPFLIIEAAVEIVVGIFTILPLGQYFHIGPIIMGCYSFNVPRYFTYYAVPFSAMSFVMFCLTLYKCGLTLLDNRAVKMPLISLFLRDGVFWFLTIFALSIAELIIWARGRPSLAQATVTPATILNAVIGARILLNLKKVAVGEVVPTTVATTELFPGSRRELARQPWYLRTDHTLDI